MRHTAGKVSRHDRRQGSQRECLSLIDFPPQNNLSLGPPPRNILNEAFAGGVQITVQGLERDTLYKRAIVRLWLTFSLEEVTSFTSGWMASNQCIAPM